MFLETCVKNCCQVLSIVVLNLTINEDVKTNQYLWTLMFLEAYLITFRGRVANVSSQTHLLTGRVKDASCIIENGKYSFYWFLCTCRDDVFFSSVQGKKVVSKITCRNGKLLKCQLNSRTMKEKLEKSVHLKKLCIISVSIFLYSRQLL